MASRDARSGESPPFLRLRCQLGFGRGALLRPLDKRCCMRPPVPSRIVDSADGVHPLAAVEVLRWTRKKPCAAGPIVLCVEVWWSCRCDRLAKEPGDGRLTGVREPFCSAWLRLSIPVYARMSCCILDALTMLDPRLCGWVSSHSYQSRSRAAFGAPILPSRR